MFVYDNKSYDVRVTSLKCSFAKLSTDQSGRVQTGEMFIDLIGTFYNYAITVEAWVGKEAEFDRFWEDISAPKPFVMTSFPYNQTEMTYSAYVTTGERPLVRSKDGTNTWGAVSLTFTAKAPQRRALL